MEVKEKSKKRELIKNIAIVFLAVMLVLTFFSNTFMNRSLPEVATKSISSGTINAKIRGSGTVSANESYEVIINQTREVRSVCVKVGDTVEQGDLLFVLGDVESQELKDAQEQLQNLNIEYQKQLLNLSKEYATSDRSIQVLREDLQKAQAQRDTNLVTDADISYAKGDLAAAKNELSQITLVLEELNALQADNEDYQNAKSEVDKWTAEITSLENSIAEYQSQLNELNTTGNVDMNRKILDAESELAQAKNAWKSDWLAYKDALSALVTAVKASYSSVEIADIDTTKSDPQEISSNDRVYIEAYLTANDSSEMKQYSTAYNTLIADQTAVETKQQNLQRLQDDQKQTSQSTETQRVVIQSKLNQATSDLYTAQRSLQQANYALSQAESSNAALKEQIKSYESAKRQQDVLVESLTQNVTDLESKKTVYDAAIATIEEKERALEDALTGKDIDKQLDNLDLQSARLQIEKQQELVDKYKEESIGTEIKANVSGTVSAINVSAGKETSAGSAMAVIDVVDRGYTIKIPVTNEQAKQVKVGDTADVTNYYWGNDVTATLEAIAPNPEKPGQGKLLVFRVTGDIDNGTTISLSIGQRSANYDTIVPKSALREDTNGHFVLVVMAKSSPLGNRYTAARVDVQVLAEDDTNAAVSGLSAGDFVITTSSKPLEAGTQVRMVENP